uniref:Uncharacterized protein n=1 Tax=Mola mola TaxID=94237 RepID=A0A3Q3WDU4_MOLML
IGGRSSVTCRLSPTAACTLCSCFSGDGCGHTVLGTESGTLASQNYPGTYPSDTWCKWRLRVPEGRTLRLLFGDFDVESSPACSNGSLVITDRNGDAVLGPVCGKLSASQINVTLTSNEVSVSFSSGPHRSGRGFLLSYASDQYPDLISCLQRGSHFSLQHLSVYCPAGCKNVTGDVWGNSEQGYRDTSVLCGSAVHAGAVSDSLGGHVTVDRGRSLTLYESTFANGILSKMGSLSEKKLLFSKECNNILSVSDLNASSLWDKNSREYTNMGPSHDLKPWLELELSDRSTVTGLITTGTAEHYLESYVLFFSKDRRNWKLYKGVLSKEKKVFEAYTDGHPRVLNSLFPPVVTRFVRLQEAEPQRRSRSWAVLRQSLFTDSGVCCLVGPSKPVIVAVGVVLALLMCGSCLLAGLIHTLVHSQTGFDSFLTFFPDYAEPAVATLGQKVGSTFRPSSDEGYTTPFTFNHYDTPGNLPEYAEPLPPEPEYATPFGEQASESQGPPTAAPTSGSRTTSSSDHYDCPSHRMLSNGYCTPALHARGPRQASAVYAEPKSCDLLQKHTYEEPL